MEPLFASTSFYQPQSEIEVNPMKMKGLVLVAGAVMAVGMMSSAVALDGAALYKEKNCFTCHGMDAKTPIQPTYPKLAGQNAEYLHQQMMDIKSGARSNGLTAAMKPFMATVSDDESTAIAQWLSTQ
jgi:cytochrome c